MKNYTLIFIAIVWVFLFNSCGNKPNEQGEYVIRQETTGAEVRVKFTVNGNIEYIQQYKKGQPEGFFANFYNSGKIKNIGTLVNGKKEGPGIIFYADGSIKSIGEYKNDEQNGNFWLFGRNKELVEKRDYRVINGKSRMNQWIKFNPDMEIIRHESNYVSLKAKKDTLVKGEIYELNISLSASYHKQYMAVIIGPFNEEYQLEPGAKCDTLIAKNFSVVYKTDRYKTGENCLRGIVQDISVERGINDPKVRNIYFSKTFYVYR